ncbi:uncharacterized protein BCR38DRAFT_332440 [Pseudomassariella vexata]|uniref:EF hand domain-containing protein n=1 Tax=Pseudomassariella vexata TaxID=1141098 RepID=A0A1Y2EGH4_9PEZI|nr:uncharacterized protein BCR38DRAFT_332440 [Pseudomassariella vexata]ORY70356.1 hypothetical protein BCR38DRAFT_332440 [Pseudomassariella vexata]
MVSSSAAVSTLTRPQVAVSIFTAAITAVSLGCFYYYYYFPNQKADDENEPLPGPGLHRSNAVRRHRPNAQQPDSDSDEHGDENVDTTARIPLEEGVNTATAARNLTGLLATDGQNDDDWYNDERHVPRFQRTGENIVTLLFRVSEDNARRNAYVHRGCQCNGCGMVPIRGIRYRCANCADFDLCEVCEAQGLHNKTHVFYKVRVPAPPFGPRHVQPAWYPGDPDSQIRSLPRSLLSKWSHETGFERVELDAFWEQWTFMANTEWRDDPDGLCLAMDRKTFERCLIPSGGYRYTSPNLIHDRMFAFYDTNKDDLISFQEFLHGVSYRKRKDKLKRTFDGYDIDGDGFVNRRDFLRMFRAYYVLYKQMHRDILEGLDDHMMTTTEAQQLVTSRAPLSSLFGREGSVPAGDHSRPIEGKIFHSNGEVDIRDGKDGAVNEDKPDTSARDEILTGLFARTGSRSLFTESFGASSRRTRSPNGDSSQYLAGIINPPQNTVDLASLINGDYSQLDDILASIRSEAPHPDVDESGSSDSSDEENHTTPGVRDAHNSSAAEAGMNITDESANARLKRIQARRQLHERWKRRQFYLDEEEGAQPPQGWDEDEDVLVNLNGIAESSKFPRPVFSARSRSSSKVRFAEDTDDFDIRSNPSTSSRSVPERWGGMEIPDAERDAGKEILYQVTQQAFNELLDDIFKKQEDLAIQCAETKEDRDKYRHLFEHIETEPYSRTPPERPERPAYPSSSHPTGERSLDELLSMTGYTVSSPPEDDDELPNLDPQDRPGETSDQQDNGSKYEKENKVVEPVTRTRDPEVPENYDPTMPQFRPNSSQALAKDSTTSHQATTSCNKPSDSESTKSNDTNDMKASQGLRIEEKPRDKDDEAEPLGHIPHSTLVTWKRLDLAEEEAKKRDGWGKLSYNEFEAIYKKHEFADSSRNRLDYLGSWIDFCIP